MNFEIALFTAQTSDKAAGSLTAAGGQGGPLTLAAEPFYLGINDSLGGDPTGEPFDPVVFTIFGAWEGLTGKGLAAARSAIGRGEVIFNTRQFNITGVGGLNDVIGIDPLPGTCTTCHDTPNVGNHSLPMALNIGLNDLSRRTTDMLLITLVITTAGAVVQTMDPGRALVTGLWADIGKTKGAILPGTSRARFLSSQRLGCQLDGCCEFL